MGSNNPGTERRQNLHIRIPTDIDPVTIYQFLPRKVMNTFLFTVPPNMEPLPMPRPQSIVFPNFPLFETIQDWLFEHDKYERIPIKQNPLTFVRTHEFDHDLIIGNFSVTDRVCKTKWVTQIPYTYTDAALAYLGLCQFSAGENLRPQYNKHKDICKLKPTHYFAGPYKGEIAYIDLSAAYWSIVWPTTIDMEYNTDQQEITSEGRITYIRCDEFAKWKPVRNVLNTLYNYREMRVWSRKKGRIIRQYPPNPIYRPYNYAYIMDIMNALVADVKEHFTLLQWLTDAAIVPANQANALLEFLFEEWFMIGNLKACGEGENKAYDRYSIHASNDFPYKGAKHFDTDGDIKPSSTLRPANIDGLKQYRLDLINQKIPITPARHNKTRISKYGTSLDTAKTYKTPPKRKRIQNERGWLTQESMRKAIPMQDDGEK